MKFTETLQEHSIAMAAHEIAMLKLTNHLPEAEVKELAGYYVTAYTEAYNLLYEATLPK